jgi:small subunit ribosomal protein S16
LAVKIRLMRVGKKKQPSYRVVVSDSRSPRDGRFIEVLGQYAPRADPSVVQIDSDRALHWLRVGAQPTEQVGKLLEISGVWAAYKEAVGKDAASKPKAKTPKAKKVVEKAEPAPAPAPAAAPAVEASAEAPAEEAAAEAPAAEEAVAEEAAAEPEATEETPAAEEASE